MPMRVTPSDITFIGTWANNDPAVVLTAVATAVRSDGGVTTNGCTAAPGRAGIPAGKRTRRFYEVSRMSGVFAGFLGIAPEEDHAGYRYKFTNS